MNGPIKTLLLAKLILSNDEGNTSGAAALNIAYTPFISPAANKIGNSGVIQLIICVSTFSLKLFLAVGKVLELDLPPEFGSGILLFSKNFWNWF